MASAAAVEAKGVTKVFGAGQDAVRALDGVSVTIRQNEFFTLLGPSGCGKTTLLRLIAGFEFPNEGEILLYGEDIAPLPPFKRPVNTVFQNYSLFPHMTVAQNIGFGLEMLGKPKAEVAARVTEMLRLVRMEELRNRKTSQISGGQQQRVALARALAPQPKVLLLDEPLSALDFKLRKDMQIELKRLQNETGITFIFVTHDQEEALTMSDRIAVFDSGRIIQEGAPMAVYERPVTRFAAGFLGEANFLQGRVTAVDAGGLARVALDLGGEASCRLASGQVGQTVLLALRPEKITLTTGSQAGVNALRGKVLDVVFSGNSTTYRIAVGEQVMTLFRQNLAQGTVAPDTEVTLSWSPDYLVQVTP